jgi:hypothetical protein
VRGDIVYNCKFWGLNNEPTTIAHKHLNGTCFDCIDKGNSIHFRQTFIAPRPNCAETIFHSVGPCQLAIGKPANSYSITNRWHNKSTGEKPSKRGQAHNKTGQQTEFLTAQGSLAEVAVENFWGGIFHVHMSDDFG